MNEALERVLTKLGEWWEGFWLMLPNLAVALVVMAGFYGLSRLLERVVRKGLKRTGMSPTTIPTMAKTASFAVSIVGLIVALHVLHLEDAAASLLAGAGVVGLAMGLAFQDVAANYFAGFVLSVKRPFQVGDILATTGVMGTIDSIQLRTTQLRTFEGQIVSIPNRRVFQDLMTNYSTLEKRRIDLEVGVSYDADLEHVERVTCEALEGLEDRIDDQAPQVLFTGFGGSSIDLIARFWISFDRQPDFFQARHAAVKAIKAAYDREGITIPFPIRTLDFGIEGGEKLSAMWPPKDARAKASAASGSAAQSAN